MKREKGDSLPFASSFLIFHQKPNVHLPANCSKLNLSPLPMPHKNASKIS
jgi:hypothetical protein